MATLIIGSNEDDSVPSTVLRLCYLQNIGTYTAFKDP